MTDHHGRFVWYELLTTDIAAARAFYGSVVGWGEQDASTPEFTYTLFTAGQAPVGAFMDLPPDARKMGATPRWVGYVAVDDVDKTAGLIGRLGGAVYVPPTDTNIGRISVVADPQTATLALVNGLKPGRPERVGLGEPGHVGWHELLAADAKTAFAFYRELFDWQQAAAETGLMDSYRLFASGGQTLGGIFTKLPRAPVPFWLYYFNVGDVDVAAERVKAGGGRIAQGPVELPEGGWIVRCIDPQGAMFALQGTRRQDAIEQDAAPELTWTAEWGGISSRGKVVGKSKR
ncbi:VOC family protein [Bradyrhizobium sp. Ash2021]|uniref:VOC family protein n=1 Tax=Bradyrhizobium sp. Ash2021 TaxID=2954771 RepID=UPI0028157877|nr:VOC family protein [Bradyrhizobium sp. Ash2021]WMT78778.1 VOC family protein [Bradyrhizobium sp. Ash2021]